MVFDDSDGKTDYGTEHNAYWFANNTPINPIKAMKIISQVSGALEKIIQDMPLIGGQEEGQEIMVRQLIEQIQSDYPEAHYNSIIALADSIIKLYMLEETNLKQEKYNPNLRLKKEFGQFYMGGTTFPPEPE